MADFKKCATPECERLVRPNILYCCEGCRHQVPREGYRNGEIDHSIECWIRHDRRTIAPLLRQKENRR